MLSPELEKAFRRLLIDARTRFNYCDFSMVDPNIGFLPSDLRLMLGYLYKRSVRQNLQDRIVSDKIKSISELTVEEVKEKVEEDLQMFASLFQMHEENNFDAELRQQYTVTPYERKFRKDQQLGRRTELNRLRAISTFFLKRIKSMAESHSEIKKLVEQDVRQLPSI